MTGYDFEDAERIIQKEAALAIAELVKSAATKRLTLERQFICGGALESSIQRLDELVQEAADEGALQECWDAVSTSGRKLIRSDDKLLSYFTDADIIH